MRTTKNQSPTDRYREILEEYALPVTAGAAVIHFAVRKKNLSCMNTSKFLGHIYPNRHPFSSGKLITNNLKELRGSSKQKRSMFMAKPIIENKLNTSNIRIKDSDCEVHLTPGVLKKVFGKKKYSPSLMHIISSKEFSGSRLHIGLNPKILDDPVMKAALPHIVTHELGHAKFFHSDLNLIFSLAIKYSIGYFMLAHATMPVSFLSTALASLHIVGKILRTQLRQAMEFQADNYAISQCSYEENQAAIKFYLMLHSSTAKELSSKLRSNGIEYADDEMMSLLGKAHKIHPGLFKLLKTSFSIQKFLFAIDSHPSDLERIDNIKNKIAKKQVASPAN